MDYGLRVRPILQFGMKEWSVAGSHKSSNTNTCACVSVSVTQGSLLFPQIFALGVGLVSGWVLGAMKREREGVSVASQCLWKQIRASSGLINSMFIPTHLGRVAICWVTGYMEEYHRGRSTRTNSLSQGWKHMQTKRFSGSWWTIKLFKDMYIVLFQF